MKKTLKNMNWKELREYKVPYIEDKNKFIEMLDEICDRKHDYNTATEALVLAAVLAFNHVCAKFGNSNFQVGLAATLVARKLLNADLIKITNYDLLLYPQYDHHFNKTLPGYCLKNLQKAAKHKLIYDIKEMKRMHTECYKHNLLSKAELELRLKEPIAKDVMKRWQLLASGKLPNGWKITDKEN